MATYIAGQTDYISQIQPTKPNLAFDAQVLQTSQSKYDANHKKVSDLYGSLLNSAMTRSSNLQARDEFFKTINDDIKRMGSMDFSLDQNVQAAAGVFQSIYTNNNIVKDMVWTKNFNEESQRGESFKNCLDETKCGGQWWEEGDRYMAYKKKAFADATADQALAMDDVKYVPYKSVMKESIKLATAAGLNVEMDKIDGNYKVTTKNGILIKTPLTALFSETIGKDPAFSNMYTAKAYVNRNDWAASKVNMGEFNTMDEAHLGYLKTVDKENQAKLDKASQDLNIDLHTIDQNIKNYEADLKAGKFKQGSDKWNKYVDAKNLQNSALQAKSYTDQIQQVSLLKNKHMAIESMSSNIDNQNAWSYMNEDINKAVEALQWKDAKQTMDLDKLAEIRINHQNDMAINAQKQKYEIINEANKAQNAIDLEREKKALGSSAYNESPPTTAEISAYNTKEADAQTFDAEKESKILAKTKELADLGEIPTAETVAQWEANPDVSAYKYNLKKYKEAQAQIQAEHVKAYTEANDAAVAANQPPKYVNQITPSMLDAYDSHLGGTRDIIYKSIREQLSRNLNITEQAVLDYMDAIPNVSKTTSIYDQMHDYIDKEETKKISDALKNALQ